jgi:2-(1,2-epoxy-1,2-dihydrophenyl)acetyl-CoA isomerase
MSAAPLLIEVSGAIATLTLNRPRVGNAIDLPTARALMDAAIRCVVLTAAGRLFCGGGDIGALAAAGGNWRLPRSLG